MENQYTEFEVFLRSLAADSSLQTKVLAWQENLVDIAEQAIRAGGDWPASAAGHSLLTGAQKLLTHLKHQEGSLISQACGHEGLEAELISTQYVLEGTAKALHVACVDLAAMNTEHKLHFTFALDELASITTEIKCLYNPLVANLFAPMG